MVAFTIFQVRVMYVTFKIHLTFKLMYLKKLCLNLFASLYRFMYLINKVYLFKVFT